MVNFETYNRLYVFAPKKVKVRANALKYNYRIMRGSPIVLDSCLQTIFAKYTSYEVAERGNTINAPQPLAYKLPGIGFRPTPSIVILFKVFKFPGNFGQMRIAIFLEATLNGINMTSLPVRAPV